MTNKKSEKRRGKIQLIDGSNFFTLLKKNLGDKGKEIPPNYRSEIVEIYKNFQETDNCQIHPNTFFGYTKVQVEQPLKEDGSVVTDRRGNPKPDTSKRDHERVSLLEDIDQYYEKEVQPHLSDSWMDRSKDKVGYEINFTKYFYKFKPLRSLDDITQDLLKLDEEMEGLMKQVINS